MTLTAKEDGVTQVSHHLGTFGDGSSHNRRQGAGECVLEEPMMAVNVNSKVVYCNQNNRFPVTHQNSMSVSPDKKNSEVPMKVFPFEAS
jgi:hypothetical protein